MLRARNPDALRCVLAALGITYGEISARVDADAGVQLTRGMVGRISRGERPARQDIADAITGLVLDRLQHGGLFTPEPSRGGRHAPRYRPPVRHAVCGRTPTPPTTPLSPTGS